LIARWAQKLSYGDSIRLMLKAVLVSPKFLYRVETQRGDAKPGAIIPVSDLELATRLSYFLWSSMPDDELLELAERGKLTAAGSSQESVKFSGTPLAAPEGEKTPGQQSRQSL
jgi:hypothetical protein